MKKNPWETKEADNTFGRLLRSWRGRRRGRLWRGRRRPPGRHLVHAESLDQLGVGVRRLGGGGSGLRTVAVGARDVGRGVAEGVRQDLQRLLQLEGRLSRRHLRHDGVVTLGPDK